MNEGILSTRNVSCALAALGLLIGACGNGDDPELVRHDEIFASASDDGVACSALVDNGRYSINSVLGALKRAHDERRVVQLFMHCPGMTTSQERVVSVLAGAAAEGLPFYTYRQLAAGVPPGPGILLSFDDWCTDAWVTQVPLLAQYGAKVTFFVSDYDVFTDQQKLDLRALADAGHDIEYHSTRHQDAPADVEAHGMAAYLADDIEPALAAMRADDYDPIVFAYPLGRRTPELDTVLLGRFALLRATTVECPH
jgi:hypothetical protein